MYLRPMQMQMRVTHLPHSHPWLCTFTSVLQKNRDVIIMRVSRRMATSTARPPLLSIVSPHPHIGLRHIGQLDLWLVLNQV